MTIGAKDKVDRMLVDKYLDKQANNFDKQESTISAEEVMKVMDYVSYNTVTHIQLSRKLAIACYGVKSMGAAYKRSKRIA